MKDGRGNRNISEERIVFCGHRRNILKYFLIFQSWYR